MVVLALGWRLYSWFWLWFCCYGLLFRDGFLVACDLVWVVVGIVACFLLFWFL